MISKCFKFISVIIGIVASLLVLALVLLNFYGAEILESYGLTKSSLGVPSIGTDTIHLTSLGFNYDSSLRQDSKGLSLKYTRDPFSLQSLKIENLKLSGSLPKSKTRQGATTNKPIYLDSILPLESVSVDKLELSLKSIPNAKLGIRVNKLKNKVNTVDILFGSVDLPELPVRLAIRMPEMKLESSVVTSPLSIVIRSRKSTSASSSLRGTANYSLETSKGSMSLRNEKLALKDLISMLGMQTPKNVVVQAGYINADLNVQMQASNIRTKASLKLLNGGFKFKEGIFQGAHANASLQYGKELVFARAIDFGIDTIRFGVEIEDLTGKLAMPSKDVFQLQNVSAKTLGGTVSLDSATLSGHQAFEDIVVIGKDISLEQIVSLYDRDDIKISGSLLFKAPLKRDSTGGFSSENGSFRTEDGGRIQIDTEEFTKGMSDSNPLKKVSKILNNFFYSNLSGTFSYQSDGSLILKARLAGKNPQFQNGRAVDLNVTLEENILDLLRSIRLNETLEKKITDQFTR